MFITNDNANTSILIETKTTKQKHRNTTQPINDLEHTKHAGETETTIIQTTAVQHKISQRVQSRHICKPLNPYNKNKFKENIHKRKRVS